MRHFVRGLIPLWEEARRELSFRVYLTDALRLIAENTARVGGGRLPRDRWADGAGLCRDSGPDPDESAEETVMRIAREAGIAILDAGEDARAAEPAARKLSFQEREYHEHF